MEHRRVLQTGGAADVTESRDERPQCRDPKGRTPLHAAAMVSNEPSVVAALAKAGAMLDARDEKGRTPPAPGGGGSPRRRQPSPRS